MADSWYHSLAQKPQNFNAFKLEFLRYFNDNNSINHLASTFTTIKQEDTEAVTTYLRCFHKNLHQIQAIQADYFIVPQILNQFIQGLHSNILQQVCSMHPINFPTIITHARDFEATELEANHAQAVNIVMNRSSDLDSKLKQFNSELPIQLSAISKCLPAYDAATNLSATNISTTNLSATATNNLLTAATSHLSAAALRAPAQPKWPAHASTSNKGQEKEPTSGTTIDTWTDDNDHHELTPILSWDNNSKGKQREEFIWEMDDLT
ncbi:hypothetical protein G9A89_015608 [Geosiphon pyriformis]|nr:hypothetical protein G9A89_015608 [Geosiphon pyriformis]